MTTTAGAAVPALSVVVVAFVGREPLERLLAALVRQRDADVEVVVACDTLVGDAASLRAAFPGMDVLAFSGRRTPAWLRAAGVARARGRVVALVEDHCVPADGWCRAVIDAHEAPGAAAAIGGAMEKGFPPGADGDGALNWAVYLADYSRYMLPLAPGPAAGASDCNVSYRRSALAEVEAAWRGEFHENVVHAALHERGHGLRLDPSIVVSEQRSLTWREALRDRFEFGRLFGCTRVAGAPLGRRAAMAAAAPALPPVLVLRVARNLLVRRRHLVQLPRATPALLAIATAWVLGELVGYLTGRPGAMLAVDESPATARAS